VARVAKGEKTQKGQQTQQGSKTGTKQGAEPKK